MPDCEYILETKEITKRFVGITAIDQVSIRIKPGEIRAIMGENGAGKSTFCNIVTGIFPPDDGEIIFNGEEVHFTHPSQALAKGIRMVYQERNLIRYLNGAQSICLGLEERRFKIFLNENKIRQLASAVREKVGANVPLDIPVGDLSPAKQQMIEILRALVYEPKLLILDEPTSSLGNEDVVILFNVLRRLKAHGVSIILITHKLGEVYEIADTISIFRNGQHIITDSTTNVNRETAVRQMLGRDFKSQYPEVMPFYSEELALEVKNFIDYSGKLKSINLNLRKGEVVGLYGLVGAGRTEFVESLYGIRERLSGEFYLEGEVVPRKSRVANMIRRGVLLIPEDRRKSGLFLQFFKIKENLTISAIRKLSNTIGFISRKKENKHVSRITSFDGLRLKFRELSQEVEELSGGNQQKIVIGRWIFQENIKVLLMDDPTQGIDVGVKHDIYVLIRSLAQRGVSILLISTDLLELSGVCDRMYVISDGTIKGELLRHEFENEKILEMVL